MNAIITAEAQQENLVDSILEFLKTKTGASACYIGLLGKQQTKAPGGDEGAVVEQETITYTSTTLNNKFLIGEKLVKNADPEKAKKEQGFLSFGLFEKVHVFDLSDETRHT